MTAPGLPNHGDTVDLVLDGFGNDGVASNLPSSSLNFGFCRHWAVGSDRLPEIFSTHRNCHIPAHLWSRLPSK